MYKKFENFFQQKYSSPECFLSEIADNIFGQENVVRKNDNLEIHRKKIENAGLKNIKYIAQILPGNKNDFSLIDVFDVTLGEQNIKNAKVQIQNFIRSKAGCFTNNFIIFHSDKQELWRFSYFLKKDSKSNSTSPKRFTYLVGAEKSCRTLAQNLEKLRNLNSISDNALKDAFSVEALTKEFYNELFKWYEWAVKPETGVSIPNDTNIEEDDREQIDTKIIRMITRIMFVWFIKQKNLVPNCIFDEKYLKSILKDFDPQSSTSGNYYNAILQNLFFATLNNEIAQRRFATNVKADIKSLYRYKEMFADELSENDIIKIFSGIPFLNGGLFECLDKTVTMDGVEKSFYNDGFSRNDRSFADGRPKYRAVVPNILFFEPEKGLLSILKRYNFTVEENTPSDQQVALDPELLGKVFENLLGVYNPETKETARNQSGSFYTPREIVNYMVDESLIAYLGDTTLVRELFSDDFEYKPTKWQDYQGIAGKLKTIKILDPACGSGAFPMGVLNRIVEILKKLDTDESSYKLKLNLIENCIYGIDIQSIAMQISKLRFFISLICDCQKDESKPNFGIPTLPNLETKFVCANSLISKKKRDAQGNLFEDIRIKETQDELIRIRHEHFNAKTAYAKQNLRKKDSELRAELANLLKENDTFAPDDAIQFAQWNPYDQNACSPFFDPEWMFGVSGGFDIVIGNPPYIQLQNNNGELGKLYAPCGYKTYARTGDIYQLFYERGNNLLKQHGHLCYITSNKWMRAGYGEVSREYFAKNTNPKLLIDFAGTKVFESATVDTNILLFEKAENQKQTFCCSTKKLSKNDLEKLGVFVKTEGSTNAFSDSSSWTILSEIEQRIKNKIEQVGTPLKDWDINIYRGVLTGYNDAFIISTEKRNEILANCKTADERERTEALIRPILRGRDIKRYSYDWAGLWLIATFPAKHYNIDDYPAVKDFLLTFGIERLEQTGETHTLKSGEKVKARKKTNNKWFETQDSIGYWEDFFKPVIAWQRITQRNQFCLSKSGTVILDSMAFLSNIDKHKDILLAVLNSNLVHFWMKINVHEYGDTGFRLSNQYVEQISIPQDIEAHIQNQLSLLLSKLLEQPNIDLEQELNQLIYHLYDLTDEEIQVVENKILN